MPELAGAEQPAWPREIRTYAALRAHAGLLIRRYAQRRSRSTAQAVIRAIDGLRQHPDNDWDATDRCACLRLRAHWQTLALTTRGGAERHVPFPYRRVKRHPAGGPPGATNR